MRRLLQLGLTVTVLASCATAPHDDTTSPNASVTVEPTTQVTPAPTPDPVQPSPFSPDLEPTTRVTPSPIALDTGSPAPATPTADHPSRQDIVRRFAGVSPTAWGEGIDGIITILPTTDKVVALTFDACGWGKGSGYDADLILFLIEQQIPATLFISGKWIDDNPGKLEYLAAQKNFEIENHGYLHKPLSVNGRAAYGIAGTGSPGEVYDEIDNNARRIEQITGRAPLFFRTGTAFYDDVAVQIAHALGARLAGYTIAADGGATFTKAQIVQADSSPPNGAILLFHMNHPEGHTKEGVRALYKVLAERGYRFVKMEDY